MVIVINKLPFLNWLPIPYKVRYSLPGKKKPTLLISIIAREISFPESSVINPENFIMFRGPFNFDELKRYPYLNVVNSYGLEMRVKAYFGCEVYEAKFIYPSSHFIMNTNIFCKKPLVCRDHSGNPVALKLEDVNTGRQMFVNVYVNEVKPFFDVSELKWLYQPCDVIPPIDFELVVDQFYNYNTTGGLPANRVPYDFCWLQLTGKRNRGYVDFW